MSKPGPVQNRATPRARTALRRIRALLAWAGGLAAIAAGSLALAPDRTPQQISPPADDYPSRASATASATEDSVVGHVPSAVPTVSDGQPCVRQSPLSEVGLAEVLQAGYEAYFGHAPTANRLACGWAHCAFEHARGQKLFGNNLGHITTTGAWRGHTCVMSFTRRVSKNPDRWEQSTQTFRVHPSLAAGAIDYWKLMDTQYPGALMACDRGEALVAARELRRRHYFTGPENRYVNSFAQLYLEALGSVIPKTEQPAWPIGPKR